MNFSKWHFDNWNFNNWSFNRVNLDRSFKTYTLQAYTLIELSILLIASGIVLGSVFYVYQLLQHQYAKQVTISRQEIVMRAIGRYVKQHGSLPYPALSISGQGLQQRIPGLGDKLPQNNGFVPWRTLGLPKLIAYDGNGYPMFYIMNINLGAKKDVKRRINIDNSKSFADSYRYVSDYYHKAGIVPEIPEIVTDSRGDINNQSIANIDTVRANTIYSDILLIKMREMKNKMHNSLSQSDLTVFNTALKPSIFLDEVSVLFGHSDRMNSIEMNSQNNSCQNNAISNNIISNNAASDCIKSNSAVTKTIDTSIRTSYSDCIAIALVGHAKNSLSVQFNRININDARKSGMIVSYITRMNISLYGGPKYSILNSFNARKLLNVNMSNKLLRIMRKDKIEINLIPKYTLAKAGHLLAVYKEIEARGLGPKNYDVFDPTFLRYYENNGQYRYIDMHFSDRYSYFGMHNELARTNIFALHELKLFDL